MPAGPQRHEPALQLWPRPTRGARPVAGLPVAFFQGPQCGDMMGIPPIISWRLHAPATETSSPHRDLCGHHGGGRMRLAIRHNARQFGFSRRADSTCGLTRGRARTSTEYAPLIPAQLRSRRARKIEARAKQAIHQGEKLSETVRVVMGFTFQLGRIPTLTIRDA